MLALPSYMLSTRLKNAITLIDNHSSESLPTLVSSCTTAKRGKEDAGTRFCVNHAGGP
jgi:hypothetical protein